MLNTGACQKRQRQVMEIDFGPVRMGKPDSGRPVARPAKTRMKKSPDAALPGSEAVANRLKDLPLIRPEKLRRARLALRDANYPPDQLLVAIADLFAAHLE